MGMLPDLIGFNLRCAQLALFQHFGATVGQDGISVPQFGTLLLIEANPDISQSAIAEALRLTGRRWYRSSTGWKIVGWWFGTYRRLTAGPTRCS